MRQHRSPRVWQQRCASVPSVTINRGESLTVWINGDECFMENAETEFHKTDGHPVRLRVTVDLDGLVSIDSRLGEIKDSSFRTKHIKYRG